VSEQNDKQAQFEEFFKIAHPISVNVLPLEVTTLPDYDEFEELMPHAFKLAGQFSSIDTAALRALKLSDNQSDTLIAFLNAQAQKIDWMLSYILEQQDDPKYRHQAVNFGGGGMVVKHTSELDIGSFAELKLFLVFPNSRIRPRALGTRNTAFADTAFKSKASG
jgi:hypothetical protein